MGLTLGLLGLVATGSAYAQDAGGDGPTAPRLQGDGSVIQYLQGRTERLPAALRDRLPASVQRKLRTLRRRRTRRTPAEPKSPAPQDIGGLPEVGSSQSWALNENPNPQRNFDLTGTPRYAGDIDGDGTNDYLYAAPAARDERTPSVLEDETGKTAVFFGGTPDETPDQFFYTELVPVGDLNGDGLDDAVGLNRAEGMVELYVGVPFVGYQDTGVTLSPPIIPPQLVVRGFSDVDGDGFEDVVLGSRIQDVFLVAYGAATPAGAAVEVYTPGATRTSFQYNVADLGGAAGTEVVRLIGRSAQNVNIRLQVFEIGSDRTLTQAQNVPVEELQGAARRQELSLVDIDGSGEPELATTGTGPMFVLPQAAGGGVSFAETPLVYDKDDARPVGDLDGDGRHDFYTFDDSTGTRYISFGPATLENGLSFDTEIPYGDDVVGAPQFLPQGGLGDVTGDGRPDVVLGLTDRAAETVGRRFFSVNSDGSGRPPVDLSFPRGHFFDAIVGTQEIGDFNADGTNDIAMVRSSLSQVEIFYGGTPISPEPDLTLEAPVVGSAYLNVTSGDVNGDGASDLVAGYNAGNQLDVYLGGAGTDAQVDHVIEPDNFGFGGVYIPKIVGDVNDDGTDDLLATDLGFFGAGQNLALFFGGSSLPTTPDATLQYASGTFAGATAAAPGDLNGDGVGDLAVGRPNFTNETTARGRADVFFGGSAFSFSSPDLTLRPEAPSAPIFQFAHGLAGGDFDGDGHGDLAVRPLAALPTATPSNVTISIFRGGPDIDDAVDRRLSVPAGTGLGQDLDGDGGANVLRGRLAPLHVGGEADGLVQGTASPTNALLYQSATGTTPAAVFRAPNQDADMGNAYYNGLAAGDITGDNQPDVVVPQTNDNNDAAVSSRVYRYEVPANLPPVAEADSFSTPQGQTLSVSAPGVLGNDSDTDGDALSASLVTDVTNGSLTLDANGAVEYTPNSGFIGTDQFTYRAVDDSSAADTTTATIEVFPGGECPLAWSLGVSGTDAAGDSLSVTLGQSAAATAGIDAACGEEEQPPKPPSDVFDLRFTGTDLPGIDLGEGLARDIRPTDTPTPAPEAESAPAIWRLEVQSSSYPVTFEWDNAALADSLPNVPVRLVDAATGGDLVDVDMKSTGSYTLENSSVTALEIRLDRALTREVPIASGWNLLSVPLEAPAPTFGATFPMCQSGFFFEPGSGYSEIGEG
ncbi:MAG: Ig-like domain-containing protein, partial [Salinibacter sp.]